ncbi:DUF2922 domain-containing protein [Clostridium perfringens]|uniref:DUF2922 domain-containing protein n=1 Tax=Clostridium perfringens TaxID=1502 RepID=UPI0009944176|nr:DUF2922 domain-containing protein [Clostridium perfringens]AQW22506.1 hypothetical protein BXT91_00840 [Clostridium perfringens]EHK2338771.1 DUF2922 domain-containing protein [Clostridium perfringens]EIF5084904.1 DUF2922 domain-containing protein [Clostridium perfringens]MBO3411611.1 DUF2922 domain-containing protein [Clostridium perfringens]MBO3433761.1 DUF2922 domain-containing protein [Clostridium perfringens]
MEKELYLVLSFKNAGGSITKITLKNIKEDVTEEEVQNLMEKIVTANIFVSKDGDLVSKVKGEIVEKTTESFEMS